MIPDEFIDIRVGLMQKMRKIDVLSIFHRYFYALQSIQIEDSPPFRCLYRLIFKFSMIPDEFIDIRVGLMRKMRKIDVFSIFHRYFHFIGTLIIRKMMKVIIFDRYHYFKSKHGRNTKISIMEFG